MGNDNQFPQGNQSPNQVTLPPWRIDNAYSFFGSLITTIILVTAAAVGLYYGILNTIDKNAAASDTDIRLIKSDVAYIREKIDSNAVISEKKLDEHIKKSDEKIRELDQLALKVAQIEAKLK